MLVLEFLRPFVAIILDQSQLDTGFTVLCRHLERNLPGTLRLALIPPQSQEHDTFDIAGHACLDSKLKDETIRLIDPQSQAELL